MNSTDNLLSRFKSTLGEHYETGLGILNFLAKSNIPFDDVEAGKRDDSLVLLIQHHYAYPDFDRRIFIIDNEGLEIVRAYEQAERRNSKI